MNQPRVSVVIPAYNEEKLLGRCLQSLKNQSVPAYEIIVVDNNSVDATATIAREHGVTVITETNQGMAWARDAGFNHATGDILARLDADCVAPFEWIEKITTHYQNQPIMESAGISGMGYYTTKSVLIGKIAGTLVTGGYHLGSRLMLRNDVLFGSCMAFPRAWWNEIKDEACKDSHAVHEDFDLTAHLLTKGHLVQRLPGFYTYIDTRTLHESPKKTLWRYKIWPEAVRRHRKELRAARSAK